MGKKKRKVRVQVYLDTEVHKMIMEIVANSRGGFPTAGNVIVNLVNDSESVDQLLKRSREKL